jgi:tetratricopeptide (TPR) repeat protein
MKKIYSIIIGFALISNIQAQIKMPALSPFQSIKQDFGMGQIELKYSRPSVRERKIFGDVVPFSKIWRTGANAASQIRFSDPVEINDNKLDSGNYAIYIIPEKDTWEVIFNKGTSNWGTDGYKTAEDVLRLKINTNQLKKSIETFSISFENMKPTSCDLIIGWEKTAVTLQLKTDVKPKLKKLIEAGMLEEKKPYYQAAQYYNEYEVDLPKAIENIDKAIEINPKAYWMYYYKAKIQLKSGDLTGALVSSQKSMEIATQEDNSDYVKLNKELQKSIKTYR